MLLVKTRVKGQAERPPPTRSRGPDPRIQTPEEVVQGTPWKAHMPKTDHGSSHGHVGISP